MRDLQIWQRKNLRDFFKKEIQQSYIAYYEALSRICEKKLNELGA